MTLDMRPMLRGEVSRIAVEDRLSPDPMEGVTFDGDARVVGEVTNEAGYMHLSLDAEVPYHGVCARCLAPVDDVFRMHFERTVAAEGTLSAEQMEENVDEYVVIEHGELNLDEELREALILSFPMRLLCEENCPGLCPRCGKPRREGPCSCPEREPDPRLAILRTLLDKNEDGKNEK